MRHATNLETYRQRKRDRGYKRLEVLAQATSWHNRQLLASYGSRASYPSGKRSTNPLQSLGKGISCMVRGYNVKEGKS